MDIMQAIERYRRDSDFDSAVSIAESVASWGNPRKAWQVGRTVLPDDEQTRALIEDAASVATPVIVFDVPKGGE